VGNICQDIDRIADDQNYGRRVFVDNFVDETLDDDNISLNQFQSSLARSLLCSAVITISEASM